MIDQILNLIEFAKFCLGYIVVVITINTTIVICLYIDHVRELLKNKDSNE